MWCCIRISNIDRILGFASSFVFCSRVISCCIKDVVALSLRTRELRTSRLATTDQCSLVKQLHVIFCFVGASSCYWDLECKRALLDPVCIVHVDSHTITCPLRFVRCGTCVWGFRIYKACLISDILDCPRVCSVCVCVWVPVWFSLHCALVSP